MINEQKFTFTTSEIKELKARFNMENRKNSEVLEEWAYREFDMRHNGFVTIGKATNTYVTIRELE